MNENVKLRELLQDSLPEARVPSGFNAGVWQRIQARSAASERRWWRRISDLTSGFLTRPAFAAVAMLVSVGGAAGTASWQAAESNERDRLELTQRHIATLDPYLHLSGK